MSSVPARGPAPWWGQLAAVVVALAAWFMIAIINNVAHSALHVWLTPVPVVTIIACLATISVRSLWPVAVLAALGIGLYGYAIVNVGYDNLGERIASRLALSWAISLTAQLAVGALAGWLWYRRQSRLAAPPASA